MLSSTQQSISAVPTNIITGFLGVGKTTVILNLLQQKPSHERWAVLVNEFGEVGVDGSLMEGNHSENSGVFIREVPGGCMCCASGLPMQIALNQLLARAKPDRLIIEPTGLGHPKEVLEVLSANHYRDVLSIQHCIALVDARNIADNRYTEHDTFNQQIDMADKIIGHKSDLSTEDEQQNLIDYVATRHGKPVEVVFAEQGNVDIKMLNGASNVVAELQQPKCSGSHSHSSEKDQHDTKQLPLNSASIPECGYLKIANSDGRYHSVGWLFRADMIFDRARLFTWLSGLDAERVKGVFITKEGIFGYNATPDSMTEIELDDADESRVELILFQDKNIPDDDLLGCLQSNPSKQD